VPLTKPCFRVPLDDEIRDRLGMDAVREMISRMKADPNIRFTAHTIDIDYCFEDLRKLYDGIRACTGTNDAVGWMTKFATPEYKEEPTRQLEASRDHFDQFDFGQPAPATGFADGAPAKAGAQQAIAANPGLVLGNDHSDQHTKDLACELMDAGQVGLMFVEEFLTTLQDDINAYLDPLGGELSPALKNHIEGFKGSKKVDLLPLLEKAKANNVKLYGINAGDASLMESKDPRHHESRCACMNEVAEKVMTKALQDHGNPKFLALCGEAHSNSFPGGIPGLAQIMGVPAVKMSKTGKLYADPDDPNNHAQPSKVERAFVDQYMKQVTDAFAAAIKDMEDKPTGFDFVELRKEALELADTFTQQGLLVSTDAVADRLKGPAAMKKQQDLIDRTKQRHTVKKECKEKIEQGKPKDLNNLLTTLQADDPHGYHRLVTGEEEDETLLHVAAKAGRARCLDKLSQHGFNLEATDKEGRTALMLAAAGGKGAAVKKLAALGADVNAATYTDGKTALHLAAEQGTVTDELLAAPGLNLNPADDSGNTPMHAAAAGGKTDSVGKMQAKGVSLDGADPRGQTALHKAIAAGQIDTALDLVQKGADVNALAGGKGPLHLAAEKGDVALLNALTNAGADMNKADADGRTPLHSACAAGKADLAGRLILLGARVDAADKDGNTPLHLALEKKLDGTVNGLLARGADPKARNQQGLSAVDVAAQAGGKNAAIVEHVAEKGHSPETRNDLKYMSEFLSATADEYAARPKPQGAAATLDEREMAQLGLKRAGRLREKGKLDNATTPDRIADLAKQSAKLPFATKVLERAEGRKTRVSTLTDLAGREEESKWDANLVTITQLLDEDPALIHAVPNLLHNACKVGNEKLVKLLLKRGANPLERNPLGETPLHKSCEVRPDWGEKDEASAHFMAKNYTGDPPKTAQDFIDEGKAMTEERGQRSANIAKALLAKVKDPAAKAGLMNAQTKDGKTALHYAAYSDHPKVIKNLCEAGARDDIRDERGWRPVEVAMASTKAGAEKALVTHGTQSAAPLVDPNKTDKLSTIDILCKATFCENPAHVAQVRKAYTQLYANEALQPVMDLAALDALRPRVPSDDNNANVGGVRFFVGSQGTAGNLYGAKNPGNAPQGAYDEKVNVMVVAGAPKADGNDFTGNVIHEMTHLATRIVHGKATKPCDGNNEAEYKAAIEKDVANATLIEGKNGFEKTAKKILCGRMTGSSYAPKGDGTLLTEFIVGVPQIMAQYGPEGAKQIAPELFQFFDGFKDECEALKTDARFATVLGRMDNTTVKAALKGRPPRDERPAVTWTGADELPDVDAIMKRVEGYYKAKQGHANKGKDALDRDLTICFDTSLYHLDPGDDGYDEFKKKMKVVRAALEKSFDPEKLGGAVAEEDLTRLVKETTELATTKTSGELKAAIPAHTATWAMKAKKHYLEVKAEQKAPITTQEVAELVVLKAEEATWEDKWGAGEMEVDEGKHKTVVKALRKKLEEEYSEDQLKTLLKSPKGYIDTTAQEVLAGEHAKTFYKKADADPGHVSINKKEWLLKLADM
jgi:ankyrin repeat protein